MICTVAPIQLPNNLAHIPALFLIHVTHPKYLTSRVHGRCRWLPLQWRCMNWVQGAQPWMGAGLSYRISDNRSCFLRGSTSYICKGSKQTVSSSKVCILLQVVNDTLIHNFYVWYNLKKQSRSPFHNWCETSLFTLSGGKNELAANKVHRYSHWLWAVHGCNRPHIDCSPSLITVADVLSQHHLRKTDWGHCLAHKRVQQFKHIEPPFPSHQDAHYLEASVATRNTRATYDNESSEEPRQLGIRHTECHNKGAAYLNSDVLRVRPCKNGMKWSEWSSFWEFRSRFNSE